MIDVAVETCKALVIAAMPISIVFELTNLAVGTFLRAAFGGGLYFGK